MTQESIDIASTVTALGQTQLSAPGSGTQVVALATTEKRFANVALLGAGGMGVVESVWDGDLMRELAIKRIRPELREEAR
ncbi:MAG TPA: hypothetical protein VL326_21080, partial [Kofleriaceae bacterium]|nr:hypothetical protein [Kofleriaceae bacterium]